MGWRGDWYRSSEQRYLQVCLLPVERRIAYTDWDRNFWVARMDYGIILDSCYFNKSVEECNQHPSGMSISGVHFENFTGYTSGVYGNAVARLSCSTSESAVCEDITIKDFNVVSPCGGDPVIICDGINDDLGVDCVSIDSDEAKAALAAKCKTDMVELDTDPWGSGKIENRFDAFHPLSYYVGDDDEDDDE